MDALIAPQIGIAGSAALVGLSLLTSALTAALGAGGGLLMLAAMATLMPPGAVIPVHGIVQLGSNGGRALLARAHVAVRLVGWLLAGGALGAALGSVLLLRLPLEWLQLSIAAFILVMVWAPPLGARTARVPGMLGFGALAGFLGLFVGANGPLVSAYIQRISDNRHEVIASSAATITGMNIYKLLAFEAAGFDWSAWLGLAALMIASGFAGTWIGLRLLGKLPEGVFRVFFRWTLSALALHLAWRALW